MVEPDSIVAIREAIVALRNNPELRQRLANAAIRKAANFDIQVRARRILEWMQEKVAGAPVPSRRGGVEVRGLQPEERFRSENANV